MKRNGNAEERRRLENRGAEGGGRGAAGARIEAPKAPRGRGVGRGCPPPHREKNLISALNMVSFGAFWMVSLQFSYLFYTQNQSSTAIGKDSDPLY